MRQTMLDNAVEMVNNRQFKEAINALKELLEAEERDIYYFKGLKLYGDILGPLTGHDHSAAVDMYQMIVNECEDDTLYESAQLSLLTSYLNLSIHYMETFENTLDVIEPDNDNTALLLNKLTEKRANFITQRAESIYKARM